MIFLMSSSYCIGTRKLPTVKVSNIKWTVVSAGFDFSYAIILYTHFIKYVPLGAIGSLVNGTDIILATLCVLLCRRIVPSCITVGGVLLAVIGICLTLYPALYPVLNPSAAQTRPENESATSLNLTVEFHQYDGNFSSLMQNYSFETLDVDACNNSSFIVRLSSSNTVKGVLTVMTASIPCTLMLMTLGGPLKDENSFILNFWFSVITTPIAIIAAVVFENPIIPRRTSDIILCCLYATTSGMVNFLEAAAMKYISPVLYDVVYSINIPLMLVIEHLVLSVSIDGGLLEILGASIVFIVAFVLPILEHNCENSNLE